MTGGQDRKVVPITAAWKVSRTNALAAFYMGVDAARDGESVLACAFQPNGPLAQQFLAIWWVKGWRRASGTTLADWLDE